MKKTSQLLFVVASLFAGWAAAEEPELNQAEVALHRTLAPSSVPYEGTLTVTRWFGQQTRTEDIRVVFSPPAHFRWEFLRPDGSVRRIVVSDGKNEVVHFVENNKMLKGGAVKHAPRNMPSDQEWALLRKNYHVIANGGGTLAGRPVLLIRVEPLADGKLFQELAVDQQTGVVLENKRFRPHGNYVVRSRFQRFLVARAFSPDIFIIASADPGTLEDHQFAPDFFSRASWTQQTGRTTALPDSLPHGFTLESIDYFMVDGKLVDHFRYTDGLSTVSIFQTKQNLKTKSIPATSEEGNMLPVNKGENHYMLMSDSSVDLLKDLAHAFP